MMITRRVFAVLAALALLLCTVLTGCGQSSTSDMPSPDVGSCCYDQADVLTAETENYILTLNDALFAMTGAQIVVACVDTTGSIGISDYAYSLFNSWGIGSAEENNGVLILLSIGEDDYWTLQGEGLEDTLPSGLIKTMQNTYLEPGFAAKDYDTGVRLYFDAVISHLETLYSVDLDTWNGAPGEYTQASGDASASDTNDGSSAIFIAIFIVIVIVVIILIASSGGGSSGGTRRRHSPTVIIPRTVSRGGYYPNPRPTVRPPSSPSRPSRPSSGSSFGGSRGGFSGGGSSGGFRGGGGSSRGGGAGRR